MTIAEARKEIIRSIKDIYEQAEANEIAELLMENITKLPASDRIINRDRTLTISQQHSLLSSISRLLGHEPVQYVINEAWFANLRFYVDRNVLIPRPETEELVEWVVSDCKSIVHNRQLTDHKFKVSNFKFFDIGTGSGCIAVALKIKLPWVEMWACDISDEALNVARINADALNATIDFVPLNFLDSDQRKQLPVVDIIVSNPPYIPQNEKKEMKKNVADHEPPTALFVPDNDPMIFYNAIADFGHEKLNKGGSIYVEIHENLGEPVRNLFVSKGYSVELKKDMQGKDRMVKAAN